MNEEYDDDRETANPILTASRHKGNQSIIYSMQLSAFRDLPNCSTRWRTPHASRRPALQQRPTCYVPHMATHKKHSVHFEPGDVGARPLLFQRLAEPGCPAVELS